METVGYTLCGI